MSAKKIFVHKIEHRDVLLGRGTGPNDRLGNVTYREMIKSNYEEYRQARKRGEKTAIAQRVVRRIREQNGRFLRRLATHELSEASAAMAMLTKKSGGAEAASPHASRDGSEKKPTDSSADQDEQSEEGDSPSRPNEQAATGAQAVQELPPSCDIQDLYVEETNESVLIQKTKQAFRHLIRQSAPRRAQQHAALPGQARSMNGIQLPSLPATNDSRLEKLQLAGDVPGRVPLALDRWNLATHPLNAPAGVASQIQEHNAQHESEFSSNISGHRLPLLSSPKPERRALHLQETHPIAHHPNRGSLLQELLAGRQQQQQQSQLQSLAMDLSALSNSEMEMGRLANIARLNAAQNMPSDDLTQSHAILRQALAARLANPRSIAVEASMEMPLRNAPTISHNPGNINSLLNATQPNEPYLGQLRQPPSSLISHGVATPSADRSMVEVMRSARSMAGLANSDSLTQDAAIDVLRRLLASESDHPARASTSPHYNPLSPTSPPTGQMQSMFHHSMLNEQQSNDDERLLQAYLSLRGVSNNSNSSNIHATAASNNSQQEGLPYTELLKFLETKKPSPE